MAKFNPSEKVETGLPSGRMLIALVGFEDKEGKTSGKRYYRCRFQVIHGEHKGKSFFATQSPNTSVSGTAIRLSQWCSAVGQTEPFDPEIRTEFHAALMGKPFFAQIKREVNGQYTNNEVERFLPLPEQAKSIVSAWRNEWMTKEASKADDDGWNHDEEDDGFGFDDAPSGGGGGGGFGDEDIPFAPFDARIA